MTDPHRRNRLSASHHGFTVLELLVTIAVLAVVVAFAAPGLRDLVVRNRLAAQANEFVGALNLARSEAVTRAQSVSLCPAQAPYTTCMNTATWSAGWIVFTDAGTAGSFDGTDEVLRVFDAVGGSTLSTTATRSVIYQPDGFLAAAAGPFNLRPDGCSGDELRTIELSLQGRPAVSAASC